MASVPRPFFGSFVAKPYVLFDPYDVANVLGLSPLPPLFPNKLPVHGEGFDLANDEFAFQIHLHGISIIFLARRGDLSGCRDGLALTTLSNGYGVFPRSRDFHFRTGEFHFLEAGDNDCLFSTFELHEVVILHAMPEDRPLDLRRGNVPWRVLTPRFSDSGFGFGLG